MRACSPWASPSCRPDIHGPPPPLRIASDEEMAAKRTAAEHATRTRHEAQVLKEESLEGEARQHYIKQGKRPCTANNV